ncbi:MAG: ribosomal L7Ae/L30e/S12e/Gadd45 family protein [Clostridia bacterium]|nr:ribosomal L7Ae/L30e/S12e/Gadd45 family protein [Clostridia bacterium]
MNPKFWGMLSLAMRAGKLAVGEDKATEATRGGKACLLILSQDAGNNTEKKVTDMAAFRNIPILRPADRVRIGQAIGKEFAVALAVTDAGFAEQLSLLFSQETENE